MGILRFVPTGVGLGCTLLALPACFEMRVHENTSGSRDAGTTADSGDMGVDARAARHPSCALEPAAAPPVPRGLAERALQIDARVQNGWRSIDCSVAPTLAPCDGTQHCPAASPYCLDVKPGEPGVCAGYGDASEGAVPTTFRDGACLIPLTDAERAALCCAELEGVDCERWPRATPGAAGELCVNDLQCETGLVCVSAGGSYGRCACPEAAAGVIGEAPSCFSLSGRARWGQGSPRLALSECVPAAAPGFVLETLADGANTQSLTVRRDPDGFVYAAYRYDGALHVLSQRALTWPLLTNLGGAAELQHYALSLSAIDAAADSGYGAFALAFEADGTPQLALWQQASLIWARSSAGAWHSEGRSVEQLAAVELEVIAGETWLAFNPGTAATVQRKNSGGWTSWTVPCAQVLGMVQWPAATVNVVCSTSSPPASFLYDPANDLRKELAAVPFQRSIVGTELQLVSAVSGTAIDLLGRASDGTTHSERVWSSGRSAEDAESVSPALALAADGSLVIAHRTPEGMAVTRKNESGVWKTTVLVSDGANPLPVIDGAGRLHVFFAADSDWSGVADQVRRVREGTCTD